MSQPYHGPRSGNLPNVHWRALDLDELRAMPRDRALPPVSAIELGSPCSYRFVRQDHPAWASAHRGVLTTGMLKEALGFNEPDTIQRLGLPRSYASQGAVQQVCGSVCTLVLFSVGTHTPPGLPQPARPGPAHQTGARAARSALQGCQQRVRCQVQSTHARRCASCRRG